jgi:hypothetical protein
MTTIAAPIDFAQTESDLGLSFIFAAEAMQVELQDKLDMLSMGTVPLLGDLAGSGTDTLRVTNVGSIGWSRRMASMGGETDTITASPITTGYVEVAIGMYGLAHEETYMAQVLGRERGVSLDTLKSLVPQAWLRTLRVQVADVVSGFGTNCGSAALAGSVDDLIDIATAFEGTPGSMAGGTPVGMVHPEQIQDYKASARNDPAFQNSVAEFAAVQAINGSQRYANFLGLGFDLHSSTDVETSGGGWDGGVWAPGAVGWARASTGAIRPSNTQGAIYVPEFGLFIEEIASTGQNAKRRYEARTWFGVAKGSTSVFVQRGLLSLND